MRNALRAFLTGDGSVIELGSHAAGAMGLLDKDQSTARKSDSSPSLDELVDKWAGEKTPATKTIQRARRVVAEFAKAAGVPALRRSHVSGRAATGESGPAAPGASSRVTGAILGSH